MEAIVNFSSSFFTNTLFSQILLVAGIFGQRLHVCARVLKWMGIGPKTSHDVRLPSYMIKSPVMISRPKTIMWFFCLEGV
jgi:hypothetical protein